MSKFNPPKWADWLIERLCAGHLVEEIQGDLHEAFHWRVKEKGITRARLLFIYEVIRSARISNLKLTNTMNHLLSLQATYLKTGWRFLKKNKAYSLLNIFGLALGISFCWLAYFYAQDELSYDQHLSDHERLFRIVADLTVEDRVDHFGGSSHSMSVRFEAEIPEIEGVAKIQNSYGLIMKGEETIRQSYLLSDRSLIDYLDLQFLEGVPGAFDRPDDVIISETLASTLNLRGKAVGSILSVISGETNEEFIIRGVYEDIPQNTSIRSDMIVSYRHYLSKAPERRLTTWFNINMNTLVKLKDPAEKSVVEKKMNEINIENDPDADAYGSSMSLVLQPISQIHLNTEYGHYNGISSPGNPELIRLFIAIGLFCLIISMINYSNFNISLYINRTREVALRKVAGAQRKSIFNQLITESFLSSLFSGILAIVILLILLPFFSDFVEKSYRFTQFIAMDFVLGALVILVAIAILSGLYPAMILSRFPIIKSLKGEQKVKTGRWITQTLLGVQFVIATVLVAGMITVHQQVRYLNTFDMKIDYEQVLYMDYIPGEDHKIAAFMEDLSKLPDVDQTAAISGYNGTRINSEMYQLDVRHLRTSRNLLELLDIAIIEGRNFDPQLSSDETQAILVNETLVRELSLDQPVGQILPFEYSNLKNPKIIGVVEDYHFKSATSSIDPLVIYQSPQYPLQSVYIKLASDHFDQDKLAETWSKHFDPFPLEFSFLEDEYLKAYKDERRMMKLVGIGCIVSIFLAVIGLIGIVGLKLSQRLKEVSIRKVLGATTGSLYQVFSQKFLLIIGVSLLIGLFLGHHLLTNWLNNYPYHVKFGVGIMGMTVLITISFALIAIVTQILRVVRANPVKFLRDE